VRKSDADEIERWVDGLPKSLGLDARRAWWPEYAFRFDDITAVASILRRGELLSRAECARRGITHLDAANQEVIALSRHAHDYVRMYFRPLTPTQFHMEGIKAASELPATGEHCPVPVFLLFDLKGLLSTEGISATNGNMARSGRFEMGADVEFLESLPMDLVYHDGTIYPPLSRDEVTFRRHAEIVAERTLGLEHLKLIVCRTGAEYETLLHLLGDDAKRWSGKLKSAPPGRALFNRRGFFIEDVRLFEGEIQFQIPPRAHEYRLSLRIVDLDSGTVLFDKSGTKQPSPQWRARFGGSSQRVEVRLEVEGHLAYHGVVRRQSLFKATF
jgi:TusA-related sulfurtransferase